jgi:beta-galactosidase
MEWTCRMYTVTGWGDGSVPAGEVIPMWGGYPDQPWEPTIEKDDLLQRF